MAGVTRFFDVKGLSIFLQNCKGFEKVLENVKFLTVGAGKCTAELKVEECHTNPMGGLHGGLSATLVDCVSTYALLTEISKPNVSVDMSLSYLKGAKQGDDILIEGRVLKRGKTLAFLEVEIKNKIDGALLVKGSHTKFILD